MNPIVKDLKILRQQSVNVESVEEAQRILQQIEAAFNDEELKDNAMGIAAIQLGIPKKVAIIKDEKYGFYPLINTEIVERSEPFEYFREGCLSIPNHYIPTLRYRHFIVKNSVIEENHFREETLYYYFEEGQAGHSGLSAIVAQHELDHFLGKLIIDLKFISEPIKVSKAVGRNEPCPCGSLDKNGKRIKYKKCCGLN